MRVIQYFLGFCTSPARIKTRLFCNTMCNLTEGDQISVYRKITNNDILKFAELTGDFNPIHTESARNIVHGAFLNGLVSGLIGTKLPGAGTVVIEQHLTFPKPCYAGDIVEITVKVVSVRKIIKCEYTCIANGENVVLEGIAKVMKKIL